MSNTIVVTGCAKRIGLGVVDFYLKNTDYSVVGVVRRVSNELNDLINAFPGRLSIVMKDLEKDVFDEDFFSKIKDNGGNTIGFVHCASRLMIDDFETMNFDHMITQEHIHYVVFDSALKAYVNFAKKFNIKEIASFINFGDYKISNQQLMGLSYSRSKTIAMNSLKSQAQYAAGFARVNMVSPGYTLQTEGYDEDFEKIVATFPFKYTSSVDDIVESVDFLVHQGSVTAQHIVVDAGAGLFNL